MSGGSKGERVPLQFAVLDGQNPEAWAVFGKSFSTLMNEVSNLEPSAVSEESKKEYSVQIEVIWCGPDELVKENRFENLAGVIIDALPKPDLKDDLELKRELLRRHLIKVKNKNKDNGSIAFKRFGYGVWFVTDNPRTVSPYRTGFNDVTDMIDGANYQYFTDERLMFAHLATYLSNIYNALERGK